MTVVFAIDYLQPETNGTVISTRQMIDALRAKGHTVRVMAIGAGGRDGYPLQARKIPLVSYIAAKQQVVLAKYDETVARRALLGADVLHLVMPFRLSYKLVRLAAELGIPTTGAFHVHPGNVFRNAGLSYVPKPLMDLVFWTWRVNLYDKVAAIHCPSQLIANELKEHRYASDLRVFSNGVGVDFFQEKEQRHDGKFQILMIGRLAAEKRADLLIQAVARSKHRQIIQPVFAGRGPKKRSLARAARAAKLPHQPVLQFFARPELKRLIRQSDLYVHAADVEIEGMSCLEAMAGDLTPLIARAPESATKQFITNEHAGFKAGSATDLAMRIDYLIDHPDVEAAIRAENRKFVRQFSLERTIIKMEKMLKDVSKAKK